MNILGLESEPLCVCQESLLLHCQGKFPRDSGINIAYLADRRGEEVARVGKLPQQPIPNHIWQVYSEVAIQMCGGRREWLLHQLFPIIVTVVNCIPQHLHLCFWVEKKKKTPNICQIINLPTLLQIRGWMSLTLYYLNRSPSQDKCSPSRRWQIGSCIHQWNDKGMLLVHVCCLHLSLLNIHSLFAVPHCHGPKHLLSWRRFLPLPCLDKQCQISWWFCHDDTWLYSIYVCMVFGFHNPCLLKLPFVSVLNYSESNC